MPDAKQSVCSECFTGRRLFAMLGFLMGVHRYHFVHRWRVESTLEEISEIMTDPQDLPRWWPAVYLETKVINEGDAEGLGRVVAFHTRGRLPYTLRWTGTTVETRHPHGYRLEAAGNFIGAADLTFEQDGPVVEITFDWTIEVGKKLLRYGSYVVRPLLANNHQWAMRMGERSLQLELARRRARTDEERASIPPPPPPVTLRRAVPAVSVCVAAVGLGIVVLRGARG